jgi:aminoglycoside/choline kinase family phosphotransferase
MKTIEEKLLLLYENWSGDKPQGIVPLPGSGSYRRYFRVTGHSSTAIGVFNNDVKENLAFLSFTRHFLDSGLPVPEVFSEDVPENIYLLRDLGDLTLYEFLTRERKDHDDFPDRVAGIYLRVIKDLPRFQVTAGKGIDYSLCYPRAAFDRQSMLWDLNYFKYYFLKLARIPFDEQKLEDDFGAFTGWLLEEDHDYFLYRDFQSRNIMLLGNEPFFIDYQGGRKGPLQYDIASLLYDAKASIPQESRDILLNVYLESLAGYISLDREKFLRYYYGFVLIRIIQSLGTYGFRGYYENKPHFLQSIPFAIKNLVYLFREKRIVPELPELTHVLARIMENPSFRHSDKTPSGLTVEICSFSYKKGIPADTSGNGGGFVFDCRALPNPGRYEEYKPWTGKDRPVIDFLKREPAVDEFLNHAFSMAGQSIMKYMERGFTHLYVGFGCTGGQHRSVYCAEEFAKHVREKYPVIVKVNHKELI